MKVSDAQNIIGIGSGIALFAGVILLLTANRFVGSDSAQVLFVFGVCCIASAFTCGFSIVIVRMIE